MSQKKLYRIKNWDTYNEALVQRGSITVWINEAALQGWVYRGKQKQGSPLVFSDTAIQTCLVLRAVYCLPLRQTEGFVRSILQLMDCSLRVPDYTTLCRRARGLTVALPVQHKLTEPIDIVIDATGYKIYGEGEWKVRKHGKSKRRAWREVHLAVNPATGDICAETLTEAFVHDCTQVAPLLDQIPNPICIAALDGAYDTHAVHQLFADRHTMALIPPQKNAKITRHGNSKDPPLPRDTIIRAIRTTSRARWKRESGYHIRSLSETTMYRQKTLFGHSLRSRTLDTQQTESRIRCRAMNLMNQLGMPHTITIA